MIEVIINRIITIKNLKGAEILLLLHSSTILNPHQNHILLTFSNRTINKCKTMIHKLH